MKKTSIFFVCALAALSLLSCEKLGRTSHRDIASYPTSGGSSSWEAVEAAGYFFGTGVDDSGNLLDYDIYNFALHTSGVEMNDNGFVGVGVAVLLDMNTPSNGGDPMRLMKGNYIPESAGLEVFDYCFIPGVIEDGKTHASYVYYRESETKAGRYYPITGGWMALDTSGAGYTVDAVFSTSIGDFRISYTGPIDFYDRSTSEYSETKIDTYVYANAQYRGKNWDVDADNFAGWYLYLGTSKGFDPAKDVVVCLEIMTSPGYAEQIPEGEYEFIGDITAQTVGPYKLVAGFSKQNPDDEDITDYYGTWFYGENTYYGATEGKLKVGKTEDGNYKLDVNFYDSYNNARVLGNVTVNDIVFSDCSANGSGKTGVKQASRSVAFSKIKANFAPAKVRRRTN